MPSYFAPEEWAVTEDHYQPELNRFMETIFFTGNGYLGLRGVPEEGGGSGVVLADQLRGAHL